MSAIYAVGLTVAALIVLKWAAQIWLERLNLKHVRAHAGAVPDAFKGIVDETTYRKSVEYTIAKAKFDQIETTYQVAILLLILFTGVLPWAFNFFTRCLGASAWAMAVFLFAVGLFLSLLSLPLAWYDQFKLEERFGFNTSTQKIWWLDRLKGLLLGIALGYPLLVLILKLVEWTGTLWWLWAWAALLAFQMIMAVLAPVLILPLFNKFTALP
jgi:STE24 endopeptidase